MKNIANLLKVRHLLLPAVIVIILSFPLLSFATEEQMKRLEQKIEAIEKRADDLEKELRQEHKPLLKEISEHITTLEKELDMVDYRTGRIKALQERVDAFSIGGDLSFFRVSEVIARVMERRQMPLTRQTCFLSYRQALMETPISGAI